VNVEFTAWLKAFEDVVGDVLPKGRYDQECLVRERARVQRRVKLWDEINHHNRLTPMELWEVTRREWGES